MPQFANTQSFVRNISICLKVNCIQNPQFCQTKICLTHTIVSDTNNCLIQTFFTHTHLGRVENWKSWKITKPQVDAFDAYKNKNICIIKKCFMTKMPLENAKIRCTGQVKSNFVLFMRVLQQLSMGQLSKGLVVQGVFCPRGSCPSRL